MTGRGQVNGKRLGGRPLCPVDPHHGYLYTWDSQYRWMCPHQDHDGLGDRRATQKFFTDEDIQRAEGEVR